MRLTFVAAAVFASAALVQSPSRQLSTSQAVLDRYQEALGGVESIRKVQSETSRGEIERTGTQGKASFVSYAKPFKSLFTVTRSDGTRTTSGFNGTVSWSIGPAGASLDTSSPLESVEEGQFLERSAAYPAT